MFSCFQYLLFFRLQSAVLNQNTKKTPKGYDYKRLQILNGSKDSKGYEPLKDLKALKTLKDLKAL